LTTLPPGVNSRPGQLPHHCPFPQCAQSTGFGAGWLTPRELFLHLNSVHLSCRHIPSPEFLSHYHQGVCSHSRALVAAGKPCPTCLNRTRKISRRGVRRHSPSQPKPTDKHGMLQWNLVNMPFRFQQPNQRKQPPEQQQSQSHPLQTRASLTRTSPAWTRSLRVN